jgi:hypothetical protein
MKLAIRAYVVTLLLLTFVFAVSAQDSDKNLRSAKDNRNTAPTAGTGGPVGGPTGLFTVYDGQTLRRGEFTFSIAYSNFDRDPGNVDLTEVPVSFQYGLTNRIELFFNTDAYRAVKVNSPQNLSGFYLPNSRINNGFANFSPGAIVLAPQGPGVSLFPGAAIFRPANTAPFVSFPYIGGSAGGFGMVASGPIFGFPSGNALIGPPVDSGGHGADRFPGLGSVYGSILPGIVFRSTTLASGDVIPTSFTTAPSYLPDAPFINRTFGESAFSTMSFGAKWRWTGVNNPVGLGIIAYYKWYMDHADDFSGFNQLQRGASPGGNRGDIGAVLFADARVARWMNVSANVGYNYTSSVKGDFPSGSFTILDRPDELMVAAGVDFPVNKYFQPIGEFRALKYVGGRTPNAFENDPMEGLIGARFFPTRWISLGGAYRYHFNQQDEDSFNDDSFPQRVAIACSAVVVGDGSQCVPAVVTSSPTGAPAGFSFSDDPHGFLLQATIGRRHKRQEEIKNQPANVTAVSLSDTEIMLPCPAGFKSTSGSCSDNTSIDVSTTAVDPENDVLTYNYTVSGGRIVGQGANVQWDVSGLQKGTYTITSGVDDGCGICGQTQTKTITIAECPDCRQECECPSLTVSGPAGITAPGGTMTFTANLSGGSQDQVTYNWTVSAGTIESGQGTPSITVSVPSDMAGGNITATVDIGGMDPSCNCPANASETAGISPNPENTLIDEFGKATDDDVKARVDNWYIQLNQNPNAQGYVINYGTPAEIRRRKAQIQKAINFRKYDASRLTFVDGPDNGTGPDTKFYLVPPGADNPLP